MKQKYAFKAELWRWPGFAGWHFVNVPKKISEQVKKLGKRYGAGFVRVNVTVGKSSWETALFPHKESGSYLLSIKKNIRKKEGLMEDDIIKVSFIL